MDFKKNQILKLTVEDIGTHGEGIAHADGFALFIKDTLPGDVIRGRITKVKKHYGFARVEEILTPSPDRVEPLCPVARACGGCTLQHLSYEKQLDYKFRKVKDCLERIGGIANAKQLMEPVAGMKDPYHYRNKAQFPVGLDKNGRPAVGFYAGRTHTLIPCMDCALQHPVNREIMSRILSYMEQYHVSPYDEKTHQGLVRHVVTRVGAATGEIMVCLVLNGKASDLPDAKNLISVLQEISGMTTICVNSNREQTNRIQGTHLEVLYGPGYIYDMINSVKYRIGPLSFYQVNSRQTRVLYETALSYANLTGNEIVWDLYCGIGTISLFLAKSSRQVYGVEIVPEAVEDAKANALQNGIENAEFFVGKAEEVIPDLFARDSIFADVVVVDPPRKGCEQSLLDTMILMKPKRIVYVSCDPATLARDVKVLCEQGYALTKVKVVDQFGQTAHVETVVLLSKVKSLKINE